MLGGVLMFVLVAILLDAHAFVLRQNSSAPKQSRPPAASNESPQLSSCLANVEALQESLSGFLVRFYTCTRRLNEYEDHWREILQQLESESNETLAEILEENPGRFVHENYTFNLTTENARTLLDRQPVARSSAGQQPVCRTRFRVESPITAEHSSGERVLLWRQRGYRQIFFTGECDTEHPVVSMAPTGRCKTVTNLHKAMFLVVKSRATAHDSPFENCKPTKYQHHHVCDDWIRLSSSCSLFV